MMDQRSDKATSHQQQEPDELTQGDPSSSSSLESIQETSKLDDSAGDPSRFTLFTKLFNKQSLGQAMGKLKLSRLGELPTAIRKAPGLGAVIAASVILLVMNIVGLVNFVSVRNEKQAWEAEASTNVEKRQALLDEIAGLETKRGKQLELLHAFKGRFEDESAQLASVGAKLTAAQGRLEEAVQKRAAAISESKQLIEDNEALKHRVFTINSRLDETSRTMTSLEAKRDALALEVTAAQKTLASHKAEVERAKTHATKLDADAAAALTNIQTARESLLKLQGEVDLAASSAAKAGAQRDAADTRLKAMLLRVKEAQQEVDELGKQRTKLAAGLSQDKTLAKEMTKSKAELETALVAMTKKRDAIAAVLAKKQGEASANKSLADAAALEHNAIKSRISTIKAELKPLEDRRLTVEASIAGRKKELETLDQQLDSLNKEIDRARSRKTAPTAVPESKQAPDKDQADDKTNTDQITARADKAQASSK